MGKSAPAAPAAPDPVTTSNAQTSSNKETALYNFGLNNPNINTPIGGVSYTVDTSDPNAPRSTQSISLSPQEQQLLNQQQQQSINLSNLANTLAPTVSSSLTQPNTTPADINALSKQAQDAYYAKQTAYLDPQFKVQQEQLDNQLANQGLAPGSEAWQNAEDQQNRNKTFAYDQAQQNAILAGPQNASSLFGLSTAARDQPLNDYNALRTGSQVQMPTTQQTSPANMQPTNVMGAYNTAYQGNINAYNQKMAQQNNMTNGIFGLGGNALMAYALM